MVSQDKIEEIKQASDIVEVIGERLTLKRAGKSYKSLCPFHSEKTPSFIVSQEKQIYHCFGCGEGGNVFSFIQKMDRLTFIESLKFLAQRAHIELDEVKTEGTDVKEKLKHINSEALSFFVENLGKNETATKYLENRGITRQTIEEFRMGYAPDGYHFLLDRLRMKFDQPELFVKAGLCQNGDKGLYDTFRNRIMFPILNVYGECIAFGGRVLDSSLPKYINSKETDLYIKGKNLYNLGRARKYAADSLIVTEGYMDTIAMSSAGFKNTAASLGTSLTEEQVKLLKRYAQKVLMMYDMDDAGMNASVRAGEILIGEGIEVFIVTYQGSKDPDDFINKNGPAAMHERISRAEPFVEFKINRLLELGDQQDPYYKEKVIKDTLDTLDKTQNLVARADGIKLLSQKLSVPEDIISGYLKKDFRRSASIDGAMTDISLLKQKGVISAERTLLKIALKSFSREDEGTILRGMAARRENMGISYEKFKNDIYAGILQKIEDYHKQGESDTLGRIQMDFIDNEEASKLIAKLIAEGGEHDMKDGETYADKDEAKRDKRRTDEEREVRRTEETEDILSVIMDCYLKIKDEETKLKISAIQDKIAEAEKANDSKKLEELLKEKQEWQKSLKQRENRNK